MSQLYAVAPERLGLPEESRIGLPEVSRFKADRSVSPSANAPKKGPATGSEKRGPAERVFGEKAMWYQPDPVALKVPASKMLPRVDPGEFRADVLPSYSVHP